MKTPTFDVIVAGVGAMGAQTCWHLARRGQRVLGLDRYDIPNCMGSSHGVHRIICLAYFEHPLYVPILRRAYELWRQTEQLAGETASLCNRLARYRAGGLAGDPRFIGKLQVTSSYASATNLR